MINPRNARSARPGRRRAFCLEGHYLVSASLRMYLFDAPSPACVCCSIHTAPLEQFVLIAGSCVHAVLTHSDGVIIPRLEKLESLERHV